MRKSLRPILLAPVTGLVQRGLTAEYRMDQRNLLKWSEDFSNAVWVKANITILSGFLDPFNGSGSFKLTATSSDPFMTQSVVLGKNISNLTFTPSAWVKAENTSIGKTIQIQIRGLTGSENQSNYDFVLTGEWQRISATKTFADSLSSTGVLLDFEVINTNPVIGEFVYFYGAQLEQSSTPTDYQKTLDNQTLWNSKKDMMSVTNLVTNGDFKLDTNSDGLADGWLKSGTSVATINNGVQSFTPASQYAKIVQNSPYIPYTVGDKIYAGAFIKSNLASTQLVLGDIDGNPTAPKAHSGSSQFDYLSTIFTTIAGMSGCNVSVATVASTGWTKIDIKEVRVINLTALFGAGNEPTLAQCDYLFNTWHDGTKVMDLPLYNGQSGSTTGADTNDPTLDGQGRSYTTDDYDKLPYMINAEQDFTVYVCANVGAVAPSGNESLLSVGSSNSDIQLMYLYRHISGALYGQLKNNASSLVLSGISSPISGIRLLKVMRKNDKFSIKDISGGVLGDIVDVPSSPITLNQVGLGSLLKIGASTFSNQPEYFASFHTCATTDAEDQRQLRAVRRELLKRGVTLV